MDKDNKKIGENIKKYRKLHHYTQKELGRLIGKTESSIQKYESGVTEVPRSVLNSIASALGLHLLDLLDTASVMDWYQKRDDAAISFLNSIGCHIEFLPHSPQQTDKVSILYDDTHYIVAGSDFYNFITYLEGTTLDLMEKLVNDTFSEFVRSSVRSIDEK